MYLTSHRVLTNQTQEGINASLYLHGVTIDDPSVAIEKIDADPGVLKAAAYDVPPGNNSVLAYLDIVADDSVGLDELEAALRAAGDSLAKKPEVVPFRMTVGRVSVQFSCIIGRRKSRRHEQDYIDMSQRALLVYKNRPIPPWMSGAPIVIEVWQDGDTRFYQPSADSLARLRLRHGPRWKSKRLAIDIFDKLDFEHYHGDLTPEAVSALTDLSIKELAAFGGVKVHLRGDSSKILFEWPPVMG